MKTPSLPSIQSYALAAVMLAQSCVTHAQVEWNLSNPNLTGAAYGNETYVVVEGTGRVWTSQDMASWSRRASPIPSPLSAVAFGNDAFVAVGGAYGQATLGEGVILRSTNGLDWTEQRLTELPYLPPLNNVAFLNGQFIAVGGYYNVNASFGCILTSPDGLTWTAPFNRPLLAGWAMEPALFGVAFGANEYLAVGVELASLSGFRLAARVLESNDTLTWTDRDTPGFLLSDVAFGKDVFVALDAGGIQILSNSLWQNGPAITGLHSIVYGKDRFVAVGDQGNIQTSLDGVAWSKQVSATSATLRRVVLERNGFLAVGDSGTILHSAEGSSWELIQSSYISDGLGGIAYGNGRFAASHSSEVLLSDDGQAWRGSQVASNGVKLGKIAFGAGKFVVMANYTTNAVLFTSPDGVVWHEPQLPKTGPLATVAFLNNRFLAGGASVILSSSDGETWSVVDSTSHTWLEFAYGDGLFLALSDQEAAFATFAATSRDGVEWQSQPTPMNISGYPVLPRGALTFGKGVFVAAVGPIYTSTNGLVWQPIYGGNYSAVMYVNDVFVASGIASIATSLDGLNWTQRPADFLLWDWWHGPVALGFGNNSFVRVCGWTGAGAEVQTSPATLFLEARWRGSSSGLELHASAGSQPTFQVQASQDMQSWSTILTLPKAAAAAPVTDPEASQFPKRFYRLATPTP